MNKKDLQSYERQLRRLKRDKQLLRDFANSVLKFCDPDSDFDPEFLDYLHGRAAQVLKTTDGRQADA